MKKISNAAQKKPLFLFQTHTGIRVLVLKLKKIFGIFEFVCSFNKIFKQYKLSQLIYANVIEVRTLPSMVVVVADWIWRCMSQLSWYVTKNNAKADHQPAL